MHAVNVFLAVSVAVLALGAILWHRSDSYSYESGRWGAVAIAGVAAVLFFGIGSITLTYSSRECQIRADDLNREHRYGLLAGCRVETDDGSFVPIENLRITNEES